MPGIAGIIHGSGTADSVPLVERMTRLMVHEPHYQVGAFASARLAIAAGWSLRSELDPEIYPVWNPGKTVGLILSGEALVEDAGPGRGSSDLRHGRLSVALSLLREYERRGIDCLADVDGWFSGLLLDVRQDKVLLFNDRFGLGRIYFHAGADHFYFASEAKALLEVVPGCRGFDARALGEYLSCGCALENRSLFQGISLLPPASAWIFRPGALREEISYFKPEVWDEQDRLSPQEYTRKLVEVFPSLVTRYFGGAGKVGMSLTGGLDGRMILASLPPAREDVPCYTFGGPYRECADVRLARKAASICGRSHQTIPVADGFLKEFPELAAKAVYVSDGCMDVSGSAELYVNRIARTISPFRMTGNYGSEILRSHVAFRPSAVSTGLFAAEATVADAAGAAAYQRLRSGRDLTFILRAQLPWHHYSRLAVEESQLTVRSPFLDRRLVALAFQAPPECARSVDPAMAVVGHGNPLLASMPNDRGMIHSAPRLLNKLRRGVQETLARIEYAYDYGMPQWAARIDSVLRPFHLERLFLGFQKFCHFRIWYRDQLRGFVLDVLRDSRTRARSYYNRAGLDALADRHARGTGNFTLEIHRILTLEMIERNLLAST